uniref:Uncharacterized protein n=1 Tax=Helianthus annuus TaxID=4232 RepID=A0A251S9C7_HELAN
MASSLIFQHFLPILPPIQCIAYKEIFSQPNEQECNHSSMKFLLQADHGAVRV